MGLAHPGRPEQQHASPLATQRPVARSRTCGVERGLRVEVEAGKVAHDGNLAIVIAISIRRSSLRAISARTAGSGSRAGSARGAPPPRAGRRAGRGSPSASAARASAPAGRARGVHQPPPAAASYSASGRSSSGSRGGRRSKRGAAHDRPAGARDALEVGRIEARSRRPPARVARHLAAGMQMRTRPAATVTRTPRRSAATARCRRCRRPRRAVACTRRVSSRNCRTAAGRRAASAPSPRRARSGRSAPRRSCRARAGQRPRAPSGRGAPRTPPSSRRRSGDRVALDVADAALVLPLVRAR